MPSSTYRQNLCHSFGLPIQHKQAGLALLFVRFAPIVVRLEFAGRLTGLAGPVFGLLAVLVPPMFTWERQGQWKKALVLALLLRDVSKSLTSRDASVLWLLPHIEWRSRPEKMRGKQRASCS